MVRRKQSKVTPIAAGRYTHHVDSALISPHNPVRVLLIGAGGTGSALISGLARMHHALVAFGHPGLAVTVCDGDTVAESNIGRQLYSPADISYNKSVVQVSRVNMHMGLSWHAHPFMFTERTLDDQDGKIPLVISAVDSAKARIMIGKQIKKHTLYWLDCGNTRSTGQCFIGTSKGIKQPKKGKPTALSYLPTILDLYQDISAFDIRKVQGAGCASVVASLRSQDLFINTQVAGAALRLLWKAFRTGRIDVSGYIINQDSLTPERGVAVDPDTWGRMGWTCTELALDSNNNESIEEAA